MYVGELSTSELILKIQLKENISYVPIIIYLQGVS